MMASGPGRLGSDGNDVEERIVLAADASNFEG